MDPVKQIILAIVLFGGCAAVALGMVAGAKIQGCDERHGVRFAAAALVVVIGSAFMAALLKGG